MAENQKEKLLEASRSAATNHGGSRLTRQQFLNVSGFKLADLFRHSARWSEALAAAGVNIDPYNQKIPFEDLLSDWGQVAKSLGRIPARNEYKLQGNYSPGVFERNFGSWSNLPSVLREFAADKSDWADVTGFLPEQSLDAPHMESSSSPVPRATTLPRSARLANRPTYGDPIDFRGLRHEPVNEDGVVFLFGMVARELGYLVESVQAGFPDCEASNRVR